LKGCLVINSLADIISYYSVLQDIMLHMDFKFLLSVSRYHTEVIQWMQTNKVTHSEGEMNFRFMYCNSI